MNVLIGVSGLPVNGEGKTRCEAFNLHVEKGKTVILLPFGSKFDGGNKKV